MPRFPVGEAPFPDADRHDEEHRVLPMPRVADAWTRTAVGGARQVLGPG
jgi:hypothetical protein